MVEQLLPFPRPSLAQPWSDPLPPSPFDYPASATTVKTFLVEPHHHAVAVLMSPIANVTAFSVKGTGSQIAYVTTSGQPASGIIISPVFPAFDDHIDVSLTVNATGPVHVAVIGLDSTFPAPNAIQLVGEDVTLGGVTVPAALADALAVATTYQFGADVLLWNGTTFDRQRGVVDLGALITAVAATTTQNSPDQTNYNGRGVKVRLNTTAIGTGSITLHVQGKDSVSGSYYDLLVGAAVVTNALNIYEVYPGVTVTANVSASTAVPRIWRVQTVANNANAASYTVAVDLIP